MAGAYFDFAGFRYTGGCRHQRSINRYKGEEGSGLIVSYFSCGADPFK